MILCVGTGRVAQLTGREVRRVLRLSHLPDWSPAKPEARTHNVVATNHKTTATIRVLTKEEVVIVLNRRTGCSLSIAVAVGGGTGGLSYHLPVAQKGGSRSISSWRVQTASSPGKTVSGVVGPESNVGGNPQKVNYQGTRVGGDQLTEDASDEVWICWLVRCKGLQGWLRVTDN